MNFWDSRFNSPEFAYGQAPNDFLVQSIQYIKPQARILSLGEGEGRNAIYLAKHGFQVDCVDMSQVGLNKLNQWAEKEGLSHLIKTFVGVLGEFEFPGEYDAIVSIWCHMPQEPRFRVHQQVTKHLKVGGVYILEAYTPSNIGRKTGGPQEPAMILD
ncbi:S-adenosyl-L-methionine-dependent methyltransferase [Gorgonomyces haynaldii]|nr:S-adenosyl-L-methionine-dependent methyltransferase [Gorgonomyces haynaldii]